MEWRRFSISGLVITNGHYEFLFSTALGMIGNGVKDWRLLAVCNPGYQFFFALLLSSQVLTSLRHG